MSSQHAIIEHTYRKWVLHRIATRMTIPSWGCTSDRTVQKGNWVLKIYFSESPIWLRGLLRTRNPRTRVLVTMMAMMTDRQHRTKRSVDFQVNRPRRPIIFWTKVHVGQICSRVWYFDENEWTDLIKNKQTKTY